MRIKCAFDMGVGRCSALKDKCCEGCTFFKSKERLEEGIKKADKRVKTLPKRQQQYIYDKYYSKRSGRPINEYKED